MKLYCDHTLATCVMDASSNVNLLSIQLLINISDLNELDIRFGGGLDQWQVSTIW